jgi:hypothetical protein
MIMHCHKRANSLRGLLKATACLSFALLLVLASGHAAFGQRGIDWRGERLHAGNDDLATKYLHDVLGTWEDGDGTRIDIFMIDSSYNIGSKAIAVDIRYYLQPYRDTSRPKWSEPVIPYDLIETRTINGWYWDRVLLEGAGGFGLYSRKPEPKTTRAGHREPGQESEVLEYWYISFPQVTEQIPMLEFAAVYRHPERYRLGGPGSFRFDFINGYLTGGDGPYYPDRPKRLTRVSEGDILKDESERSGPRLRLSTPQPREVRPDGKSTVEITATLHEDIPGQPSKPLADKRIDFRVDEQQGVTPGTISASAVTDADGQVKVTFTAPTADALRQADSLLNRATITARNAEFSLERTTHINFSSDRGQVNVIPTGGIISAHGIVPPDGRFPAMISVYLEDDGFNPLPETEVTFQIAGTSPHGMLRSGDGQQGTALRLRTDQRGWAEVQYFYAADGPPEKPVTETVEIKSAHLLAPLKAEISIGLDIVFAKIESAYEGRGIVNAGEEIPLRVWIKDSRYQKLDLSQIVNYWGLCDKSGDTKLYVKLEVENLSSVPDYLLDQLKLQKYPEPAFSERMEVRSFRDKGETNMLWMPAGTLKTYQGYPRIRPMTSGTHYYEARVLLLDDQGKEVVQSRHPSRKAYFNIQTGLPADAMQVFFISNPFGPHTREARVLRAALDYMGVGTVLSVVDALDAINRGDTEELFSLLFSEVKGSMIDKAEGLSPDARKLVGIYTGMTTAEMLAADIALDRTGTDRGDGGQPVRAAS